MTQIKRLNCKIECYISGNYNIPIIIDSVIIPNDFDFDFEIYDFSKHCFNNKIDLFIPSIYKNNKYYYKYLPNEEFEIELHFLISLPFKNKKINAFIKNEGSKNVTVEYNEKKIDIFAQKTEFSCRIKITSGSFIKEKIAVFKCQINGIEKEIIINSKEFETELNRININEINIFKYDENTTDWKKIDKQIRKNENDKNIYICPFGFWTFNQITYYASDQENNS